MKAVTPNPRRWLTRRGTTLATVALGLALGLNAAPAFARGTDAPVPPSGEGSARREPSLLALAQQALRLRLGLFPAGTRTVREAVTEADRKRYGEGAVLEHGWIDARRADGSTTTLQVTSLDATGIRRQSLERAVRTLVADLKATSAPVVVRFTHTHPGSFWRALLWTQLKPISSFSPEDRRLGTWLAHELASQGLPSSVEMTLIYRDARGRLAKKTALLPPPLALPERGGE